MAYPAIKIRALQAFVAVYEEQSFSRAAERENTTQSGMSTQVKGLELILGAPLLIRERKKFMLTPQGEIVYQEAQGILRSLMATEQAVREMQGSVRGVVRFGMIPSLTRSALIPALEEFKGEFPDVELSLLEEYSYSLMRRVLDGELDFAMVPSTELPAGLTGKFIGRDREMLVSSTTQNNDTAHLQPVSLSALSGARLIVPSRLNVRRTQFDMLLNNHGIKVAENARDGRYACDAGNGCCDRLGCNPAFGDLLPRPGRIDTEPQPDNRPTNQPRLCVGRKGRSRPASRCQIIGKVPNPPHFKHSGRLGRHL